MKYRLCKSVPIKFVSVSKNVDVLDVVQMGVDCNTTLGLYSTTIVKNALDIS